MKRLLLGVGVVLALAVAGVLVYAVATATGSDRPVGLTLARVETPQGPMAVAVWYPTSDTPRPTTFLGGRLLDVARDGTVEGNHLPVLLISHGNGGSFVSHVDTALAFAGAGYVVATPLHVGDNFADQGAAASPTLFQDRAAQLGASLDYLLHAWQGRHRVDAARVGAFGMSAGGFAVLNLVGGVADLERIPAQCSQHPEFICAALRQARSPLLDAGDADVAPFPHDPRIKAAAVAAPGLGFTFPPAGLSQVRVPVQVWYGTADTTVPFATNAQLVLAGLGSRAEAHAVPGATHFSFLAPCGLLKPAMFCKDPAGFDRVAMHRAMNAEMVAFFDKNLH